MLLLFLVVVVVIAVVVVVVIVLDFLVSSSYESRTKFCLHSLGSDSARMLGFNLMNKVKHQWNDIAVARGPQVARVSDATGSHFRVDIKPDHSRRNNRRHTTRESHLLIIIPIPLLVRLFLQLSLKSLASQNGFSSAILFVC